MQTEVVFGARTMPVDPQFSGDIVLDTRVLLVVKTVQRSAYDSIQLHNKTTQVPWGIV